MRRTPPRPLLALSAAALSTVLLAGCGGDGPEVTEPTGDTATGPTTETTEATEDAEPTEDATQTPGPTGPTDPDQTGTTAPDGTGTGTGTETTGSEGTETTGGQSTGDGVPEGAITSQDGSFAIVPPQDWEDISDEYAEEMEMAVRSTQETSSFYNNFVISAAPAVPNLRESAEATGRELAGDEGFEMLQDRTIDGEDAFGYVLTRDQAGTEIAQSQWYTEHDDTLYVFTMSSAAAEVDAASATMEQVLESWTWLD